MARFNNNMFQGEDFNRSGIMNPELTNVMNLRKEANAARDGANDQYTADVADFKNNQATDAEQGIASLPTTTAENYYNPSLFGYDVNLPDNITSNAFQFDDVDTTGYVPDTPTTTTNPYVDVFTNNSFEGQVNTKFPIGPDGQPILFGAEDVDYTGGGNPINVGNQGEGSLVPVVAPTTNPYVNVLINAPSEPDPDWQLTLPAYDTYISPTVSGGGTGGGTGGGGTGGGGTGGGGSGGSSGSLPDLGVVDPSAGGSGSWQDAADALPRAYETVRPYERAYETAGLGFDETLDLSSFGTAPNMSTPPSATYTGLDSTNYTPPTAPELAASLAAFMPTPSTTEESFPALAGLPVPEEEKGTGLANGGRVPMGNNNILNSGLSRLPINQQNDTLTQVFQSGFRPRR